MTKVYPNAAAMATSRPLSVPGKEEVSLTVWRKSLLLNCSGFTVFDSKGNLVFRVDNYVSGTKAEIILMDASGKPLLTVRRKRLSFIDNWQVFDGDSATNPRFAVRKPSSMINTKCLAQILRPSKGNVVYEAEGSYQRRCCAIYDDRRKLVAEIKRKESVGNDVFRLVVQPDMSSSIAMSVVILLDQMFSSSRQSTH